jgi:NADH dehydrogenase FAD-containing subunit
VSKSPRSKLRRIVIAGGGLAGHRIAYALQREADVTLIDPKDFFEIPMAVPRMLVEPDRALDAIIPYRDFLPQVKLIRGALEAVQPGFVTLAKGELPYDYLVIATGAAYAGDLIKAPAGTTAERRMHLREWAGRVREAGRILIVGGGPVGVEIAGEILEDLPGKKLTLIHSGPQLLPSLTPRPQRYALAHLQKRGAEVRLGERAGDQTLRDADLVLWCAGSATGGKDQIQVDQHLRVAGTSNTFAVGDITSLPEPKMGIWAGRHASVVIENLRRLLRAGPGNHVSLKSYKPATGSQTMLVTLGRRHGTGHLPLGDFTNSWFARQVKSRDMFIGRYRKALGLPYPAPSKA